MGVAGGHLVEHQIERRHDIDARSARAGFEKGVPRRAEDMAIGIHFEHQAHGRVRIIRRRLAAHGNVIGGNELLPAPPALVQQQVRQPNRIRGPQCNAAASGGVGQRGSISVDCVAPRSRTIWVRPVSPECTAAFPFPPDGAEQSKPHAVTPMRTNNRRQARSEGEREERWCPGPGGRRGAALGPVSGPRHLRCRDCCLLHAFPNSSRAVAPA